jgi:hypothetical protein
LLLIQTTLMLASLASAAGGSTVVGGVGRAAPMWAINLLAVQAPWPRLELVMPCARVTGRLALPCISTLSEPLTGASFPVTGSYAHRGARLPAMSDEMDGTLGGYANFDVMDALHLSAGPLVSWLTPDSPREDLLRLRVVAPGWGVRYTWDEAGVSVGVAASTRFVMLGEGWTMVDVLASEARLEFLLP